VLCKGQGSIPFSSKIPYSAGWVTLLLLAQPLLSVRSTNVNKDDSQNLDLIIRNGLAGGAAGCAVSLITLVWVNNC
jgi:hypothetical protein